MHRFLLTIVVVLATSGSVWAQTESDAEIRNIGDVRRGEFVAVRGEVVRFREHDELRIQDSTGRIDIYLGEGSIARPPFGVGDTIIVLGWVDDDLFDFPRDIYATEIILEDGTTITIRASWEWD